VTDFATIAPFADEIIANGYGFSTLSEPRNHAKYDRDVFIEVLKDWEWYESEALRPKWLLHENKNDYWTGEIPDD
jgi:hypothetical protein